MDTPHAYRDGHPRVQPGGGAATKEQLCHRQMKSLIITGRLAFQKKILDYDGLIGIVLG
jgi:hypothetical protein